MKTTTNHSARVRSRDYFIGRGRKGRRRRRKLINLEEREQVPVGTTMRPGSGSMVAEEEGEEQEEAVVVYCDGGQY